MVNKTLNHYSVTPKDILFYIIVALILVSMGGCKEPEPKVKIDPDKYSYLISTCIGFTCISQNIPVEPDDISPDDPTIPRPKDCDNCYGRGYIGDGTIKTDCVVCDYDGDGDADDDAFGLTPDMSKKDLLDTDGLKVETADINNINFVYSSSDAQELAIQDDKQILVVLSKNKSPVWDNVIVREFINAHYIVLYGNTQDVTLQTAWASQAKKSLLTEEKNNTVRFTTDVMCVLSSEGKFITGEFNAYKEIPLNPTQLIETLKNYD